MTRSYLPKDLCVSRERAVIRRNVTLYSVYLLRHDLTYNLEPEIYIQIYIKVCILRFEITQRR